MAKNLTEFEILKKQKAKQRLRKKLVCLCFLFLIVYFIYWFYNTNYTSELINNVDEMFKSLKKGTGYPVDLSAVEIKDKSKMGNDILILDEDVIYVLNKYGAKTLLKKHGLSNPRVVSNNKKSVVYEHLGNQFQVYLKTKKLFEKKLDNIIYNMSISNDGKLVVVKDSNQFISSLEVYNKSFTPIFQWNSADKYITHVSFENNNQDFAVASLEVDGAEYVTTITFLNINKKQIISEIALNDETVLSIKYKNNDLYIIGTKNAYIINSQYKIKYKYEYDNRVLKAYNNDFLKNIVLIFDNYNKLDDNDIIFLNENLEKIGNQTIRGRIKDVSGDKKRFYILTDQNILEYNIESKFIKKYELISPVNNIISVYDRLYKISLSEIDLVR